ncbi:hypothetical protein Fmac_003180 [Flemingia macrophylla]|uniref:Heparanase-like protein 1 n=1 Tax=Flemingia macrophylla TaxID=520843 RepID=A0ABD1NM26_9FABA
MDVKVTFCFVLFSLICLSSAENVNLGVEAVTTIATTDENFVCATLDWWPSRLCIQSLENQIRRFTGRSDCLSIWKTKGMSRYEKETRWSLWFSEGCLPKKKWDEINHFFNKTRVKFTFGLNALAGKKNSEEHKGDWVGNWNPTNAISLMEYELCSGGVGASVDSVQYAKDITTLKRIVNLLYPNANTRPKVLAPGGFYSKDWFESFLQNVEPGVVDGVTHHIYNLGAGDDKNLIHKIQNPYYLSQVAQTFKDVSIVVNEYSPSAGAWVGESGGAYNSGGKDVSNTFVNGFWYLDQLGMTSTFNHKAYCRQALVGGNYGLLNTTTLIPNPDFYGALLWHRLMGHKVLSVFHEGSPYLRAYAHCSKKGAGISVLLINMSNCTFFQVYLDEDINLHPSQDEVKGRAQETMTMREEYHLRPEDGNIQSDVVLLNGTPLKLTKSKDIPEMKPKLVDPYSPISVASDSIVFVHSKSFNAPACG